MISDAARRRIDGLVEQAVAQGARVSHRAALPDAPGHFTAPTLLIDVPPNATDHGLAAYVFAGELGRAVRLAERLEAGVVGINRGLVSDPSAPFGGMKQSGLGREGARAGLREFQECQYLGVDWTCAENPPIREPPRPPALPTNRSADSVPTTANPEGW